MGAVGRRDGRPQTVAGGIEKILSYASLQTSLGDLSKAMPERPFL